MVSKCELCHTEDESGCCSDEIFVTLHDALRVSNHTGIPIDKLVKFRKVSKELQSYNENNDFSRLWRNKKLLMIARHKDPNLDAEDCRFTGKTGCTIFEARPRICRVFPFWFRRNKTTNKFEIYLDKDDDDADEFCRICRTNTHEDIKGALADCGEKDRKKFESYCRDYEKEMEEYNSYADDLATGKKPSVIIKERNIVV